MSSSEMKLKFLQHALSSFVYNRSLFVSFSNTCLVIKRCLVTKSISRFDTLFNRV